MSLFEKKQRISRSGFREALRKAPPSIPGGGGMFSRQERVKMEKELFPWGKYGSHISQEDCKRVLGKLREKRYRAQTYVEKTKIDRQIRFLKKLGGI